MTKLFKPVTITLPIETIQIFKNFCVKNKYPFSRFLLYAGLRFIKTEEQESQEIATLSSGEYIKEELNGEINNATKQADTREN
ncbi:MAG: hypothetical protein JW703_03285 [Candidatus Diapherotrites archaeon]|nr:hypothetical protein [Candidatus Diapherotrites archaeon]